MFAHGYRRVLALLTIALFALPVIAQETPMSAPRAITALQDSFSSGFINSIPMPDTGDGIDISSFTLQLGEPGASCTASSLSHSAWFKVIHPGGTLDINTAYDTGSAFDSVLQLFRDDTGNASALTELACDDNSGGGSSANDARLVLPNLASDTYLVRITCIALCGGTTDLALAVSYTPDQTGPLNDSINAAKPLVIGKAKLTKKVQHTTVAPSENTVLTCPIYNTVWYTMTVPVTGMYSFSTYGSMLNRIGYNPTDTRLAVYVSSGGPIFTNLTQKGCNDDYGNVIGYSALTGIALNAGEEVYVRVGTYSAANLMTGSYYRLKTTIVNLNDVLLNGSFETGSLAPWTMTSTTGVDGVTGAYSDLGAYSVRIAGAPGKVNTLKQKWSTGSIKLPPDGMVVALFSYSTNGTVSDKAFAILRLTYTDGTPAQTMKYRLKSQTAASTFVAAYLHLPVRKANVKDIIIMFKNKSTDGLLFVDSVSVRVYGDPTRAAKQEASDALLPVPESPLSIPDAPADFRGTN